MILDFAKCYSQLSSWKQLSAFDGYLTHSYHTIYEVLSLNIFRKTETNFAAEVFRTLALAARSKSSAMIVMLSCTKYDTPSSVLTISHLSASVFLKSSFLNVRAPTHRFLSSHLPFPSFVFVFYVRFFCTSTLYEHYNCFMRYRLQTNSISKLRKVYTM